jgi:hypothetical protein
MRRFVRLEFGLVVFAAVLAIAALALPAHADQYLLTSDHCTGGCGPQAQFGTVDVTQSAAQALLNQVQITVTLENGNKFVDTGFPGSFAFNDGSSLTLESITSGFSLLGGPTASAGALKFDGFGTFEYAIVCTACGSGGSDPVSGPLTFVVSASGLDPSDFAEKSTIPPGDTQAFFAADILSGTTGLTGLVDASNTAVPEPGTLALAGTALIGVGIWARRRVRGRLQIA